MNQLETDFVDVIDGLDLPDVDLASAVIERIDRAENDIALVRPGGTRDRRAAWFGAQPTGLSAVAAAVALIVLTAAAVLALTPAGQAVADWLGIGSTGVEIIDGTGDGDADDGESGVQPGSNNDGGADQLSIDTDSLGDEVRDSAADPISSVGPPEAVFDDSRRGRSYYWQPEAGAALLLSVRSTKAALAIKSVVGAEGVEFLTLGADESDDSAEGLPALWIGDPHGLRYPGDEVDLNLEMTLLSGPVLIWLDAEVEYRLEGVADRTTATDLAREVMAGVEKGTELVGPG